MIRLALLGPQGSGKTELVRFLRSIGLSVAHYEHDKCTAEQNMGAPEIAVYESNVPVDELMSSGARFNGVLEIASFRVPRG